jgi:hypothetical protein
MKLAKPDCKLEGQRPGSSELRGLWYRRLPSRMGVVCIGSSDGGLYALDREIEQQKMTGHYHRSARLIAGRCLRSYPLVETEFARQSNDSQKLRSPCGCYKEGLGTRVPAWIPFDTAVSANAGIKLARSESLS